jgi:hypothetical protein
MFLYGNSVNDVLLTPGNIGGKLLQKIKLSTIEVVFVLIAAACLFVATVHQMSTSGVLPGNDPAVHLGKARQIVIDERVSYSEVAWYPPLFHTIVAILQIFAGTLDAITAAFLLKMLIAAFNVIILLSTYLLSRKLFGIGVAVFATVLTILSIPVIEMVFWGGYANLMGLAYIALVFYVMNKDFGVIIKTFLLFLGAFTLVLSHQLTAFVFVLTFVPAFFLNSIGSKRKFLAFLAVVVGGGLALTAWYARIIIDYADIVIEHIFFAMEETYYLISTVTFEELVKNLGPAFFLALAGIPLMCLILKKKKALKDSILIIFWFAVPFLLAQSYLIGINLPYNRFIYFFETPIAILSAVTLFSFTKLPEILQSRVFPKITKIPKKTVLNVVKIVVLAIIVCVLVFQAYIFVERVKTYPEFYERGTISSYYSGLWAKQHSVPDGTVISTRSPGSWFYIFSDHRTIQETDPIIARSPVPEALLYSFYEMDNSVSLNREFESVSPSAGQAIYVSRFNIWKKAISIPNDQASFIYVNPFGLWIKIPLTETEETIYWLQNSTDTTQLVTEYNHELFTVEKVATFSSNSSAVHITWKVEAHQDLANVKLAFSNNLEPSFNFTEALLPGILEWQNPWENATYIDGFRKWAVTEGPSEMLNDTTVAMVDETNGILTVIELEDIPDWFILGALTNRFIDALRLRYEFGYLEEGEIGQISLSVLAVTFEDEEIVKGTAEDMRELLNANMNLPIQVRDYKTYIDEYNIKFVAVDTQKVLSQIEATPALDKIYDNGRDILYTTKR